MATLPGIWIRFDVDFAAFINVSDHRLDNHPARHPPENNVPLGETAEMDIIIETTLFNFLDRVRVCKSFRSVHVQCFLILPQTFRPRKCFLILFRRGCFFPEFLGRAHDRP